MYFGNILMMIWKAVFTKYAAQGIRDVSDIRLYPVPAGYPATFHYPVPVPDSQETA